MQHLSWGSRRHPPVSRRFPRCQAQVRFCALLRIKPHAPPLVRAPVNSFEFQPCGRTPQAEHLSSYLRHGGTCLPPTSSVHRLQPGLPGYLIPFAPLAFAPQRQCLSRKPPTPPVFLPISTHFTATLGIPLPSPALQPRGFTGHSRVELGAFTHDFRGRLRALYAQ